MTYKMNLPGGPDRLRALILYVCERCSAVELFGKVKLNKILWRADFEAFAKGRIAVSGRPYQRLAAGPAPIEMLTVLAEMQSTALLSFDCGDKSDGYVEDRPKALKRANLRYFSPDDLSHVDAAIRFYWRKSATAASGLSHGVAWKSHEDRDRMPYESVFLSDARMSGGDKARLASIGRAKGWTSL